MNRKSKIFLLIWATGDFGISYISIGIPSFKFERAGSYAPIYKV